MTKVESYLLLLKKFKEQKFSYDINNSGFKGNLAYFIDVCIERKDWNKINDTIINYLDNNDLNEACYYISKILYEFALLDAKKYNYPEVGYRLQKNRIEDLYKNKKLDEFQFIPFQCYPEWYAEVNFAFEDNL